MARKDWSQTCENINPVTEDACGSPATHRIHFADCDVISGCKDCAAVAEECGFETKVIEWENHHCCLACSKKLSQRFPHARYCDDKCRNAYWSRGRSAKRTA